MLNARVLFLVLAACQASTSSPRGYSPGPTDTETLPTETETEGGAETAAPPMPCPLPEIMEPRAARLAFCAPSDDGSDGSLWEIDGYYLTPRPEFGATVALSAAAIYIYDEALTCRHTVSIEPSSQDDVYPEPDTTFSILVTSRHVDCSRWSRLRLVFSWWGSFSLPSQSGAQAPRWCEYARTPDGTQDSAVCTY